MKSIWVFFALFVTVNASAAGSSTLADYYRQFVEQTPRTFHAYHYASREDAKVSVEGPLTAGDQRRLKSYPRKMSKLFLDLKLPESQRDTMGLYLANDPVISRNYGGDHWILARFIVPSGVKMLNLDAASKSETFPEPWKSRVEKAGCAITDPGRFIRQSTRSPECRKLAVATLKELDVDLIAYGWLTQDFKGFSAKRSSSQAFIVLDTGIFNEKDIAVFASNTQVPEGLKREQKMIAGIFAQSVPFEGQNLEQFKKGRIWVELSQAISSNEVSAWISQNLLGF